MATQPSSFRSLSDVDRELAAMSQSLDHLVRTTDALQKTATEQLALVDMAVVMTEAHDYAEQTRQGAEAHAQQIRAQAEAEAAAQRAATAAACAQAEASARATVERLYTEANAALSRLQTDYTERCTALARMQTDTREAWTAYKAQLAAAHAVVEHALTEPPPTLPALEPLTALAVPTLSAALGTVAPEQAPTLAEEVEAVPEPVPTDASLAASAPTLADGFHAVPDPVPTQAEDVEAAPSDELLAAPTPTVADAWDAGPDPVAPLPDPLATGPRLIANPLDPRRPDQPAVAEFAAPLADASVADAPEDTVAVPETAADAALPLDPPVPSLGEMPARPLVLRDQPLPTIAEPGFGR